MAIIGKIILTQKERGELLSWSRSMKMDYRYVLRAKIILALIHIEWVKNKQKIAKGVINKGCKGIILG